MKHGNTEKIILSAYTDMCSGHYEEALKVFDALAEQNQIDSLRHLGWMHELGLGTTIDLKRAEYFYQRSAQLGDVLGYYYLGRLKMKLGDLSAASAALTIAAQTRNPSAAYWLSVIYSGDYPQYADLIKEQAYLEEAASLGHLFAQRDLLKSAMRASTNVAMKALFLGRYLWVKLMGFFIIFKDHNDLRVR